MTTAGRALASMGPMFFSYLWRELRRRQRQAVFIALGLALAMSVPTAKTHVSRILAKLGARDRAQLVVPAFQAGLVQAG